jgi:hypothetical protein
MFLGIEGLWPGLAEHRLGNKPDHTLKPEPSADNVDRVHSDFRNFEVQAKSSNSPSSLPPSPPWLNLTGLGNGARGAWASRSQTKTSKTPDRIINQPPLLSFVDDLQH